MGRRLGLTDEVRDRILLALRLGATNKLAANYAGVSVSAYYKWMKIGEQAIADKGDNPDAKFRKEIQPCVDLVQGVKKAKGEAAVRWLSTIEEAAQDNTWQAAAWKLERRYPRDYGRRVQEVSGEGGGPIKVTFGWIDEEGDE